MNATEADTAKELFGILFGMPDRIAADGTRVDVKTSPTLPIIHLNGSSGSRLQEQYEEASALLSSFARAFDAIEFNARDYYLVPGSFQNAARDREIQSQHINGLRRYLAAHVEGIDEQNEARRTA